MEAAPTELDYQEIKTCMNDSLDQSLAHFSGTNNIMDFKTVLE